MKDIFFDSSFYSDFEQTPLVLVDVGASGGLDPKWSRAAQFLRVVAFEPDKRGFEHLTENSDAPKRTVLNTALYKSSCVLPFYLVRYQQWSSILKPNRKLLDKFPGSEGHDIEQVLEIEVDTLDHQLRQVNMRDVDALKLDTQGSELFVLEGGQQTLLTTFAVEVEVEFVPLYLEQPLFAEVETFLRKFEFELLDLDPRYWKREAGKDLGNPKGQIVSADALFLRSSESFCRMVQKSENPASGRRKLLRALSLCVFYGYIDYALELLQAAGDLLLKEERELLNSILKTEMPLSGRIPNVRGRWRASELLYRLHRILKPSRGTYSSGGRGVGNME